MLPLMLASADAFRDSYRRALALPFLPFPTHTMPFFSLLRRLLCFPSAFLNNYKQTQSVVGDKTR
jgi:hypothetical protein